MVTVERKERCLDSEKGLAGPARWGSLGSLQTGTRGIASPSRAVSELPLGDAFYTRFSPLVLPVSLCLSGHLVDSSSWCR